VFSIFEFGVYAIEHIVAIDQLSALGGLPALFDVRPEGVFIHSEDPIPLFQKPQCLGNHFARRFIAA